MHVLWLFLMRVSLHKDPYLKTASHVATLEFVRRVVGISVPKVITFDTSSDNELGFEWILMGLMPGRPLHDYWKEIESPEKIKLVKQLAIFQAKLFNHRFGGIGNLYYETPHVETKDSTAPQESAQSSEPAFILGKMVSKTPFRCPWPEVPAGPFKNSHDWLHYRLSYTINAQEREIEESIRDGGKAWMLKRRMSLAVRLLELLPSIFPVDETESTFLRHDNLSLANIQVDEFGDISAITDWECISALPLWRGCLEACLDDTCDSQLRVLYVAETQRLQPDWEEQVNKHWVKADFERAVHHVNDGCYYEVIQEWLDGYDDGWTWSWRQQ
ncbi:uncharacterized protein BP5553_06472 [Venustampulla echinocandica]|uniref:Aminoglycoside phosphotransferase domain-containing protein n=1 Tax=Venustampulla echinocandica TaxID=2656787 RepID=A0A370TK07_9HELO|nr:uncharacterized protein BP5553_06472 [Venustampulla echinocandica]RDL35860.1 hypothetical protein BP5553_06472 [Venustampulla echinocandica]